ncbi:MAG TPA: Hsp20/alpha crystallin family protein [Mycobacteriales bacterium]|nr:Hsp20/alpha crystallin family protein [Mycobacteriales bacterium]
MLLERVDPFLAEFDRLTQRAFGGVDGIGMPMDVIRRADELVVTVDLPGVASDKMSLTVENHVLTIAAERRGGYGDGDQLLAQERFDGTISRRLRVPDWVDAEAVTADYVDGVLTVHLPLAEKAKPRRIEVSVGKAQQAQIES